MLRKVTDGVQLVRLLCPNCGKPRVFRRADLSTRESRYLARTGDVVTVSKPCPNCGEDHWLRIRLPPSAGERPPPAL